VKTMARLIDYRADGYSQSGEQGIILRIFEVLGLKSGLCCEFGAWDGIYLSNTRALMDRGWRGLMIEADEARFTDLRKTYPAGSHAICVNALVDAGTRSLAKVASAAGITDRFEFVSIDVDGADYDIFAAFFEFSPPPLVVCVEVHPCHHPDDTDYIDPSIAAAGPGQPLGLFASTARRMGYRLVCFLGANAFFIHADADLEADIPPLTPMEAWLQNLEIVRASPFAREFLYLANIGMQQPSYRFNNPLMSARGLGIGSARALQLRSGAVLRRWMRTIAYFRRLKWPLPRSNA
jgi:hypothetical protein